MDAPRTKTTPFEIGIVLLTIILIASLMSYGVSALEEELGGYTVFLSYAVTPIVSIAVLAVYLLVIKKDKSLLDMLRRPDVPAIGLSVVAGAGVLAMLMIANYAAIYIASAVDYTMTVAYPPLDNAWQWILTLVCICILPAIVEEVLFRGLVRQAFGCYGDVVAILMSSLMFALFHFNLAQSVYPFLYGIILGLVVAKTGNLYYAMVMHFVNNLLTILMYYFGWGSGLEAFSWQNIGVLAAIAVSGCAVFYTAYAFMLKSGGEKTLQKKDMTAALDARTYNWGSVFSVGVFVVLYICVIIGSRTSV